MPDPVIRIPKSFGAIGVVELSAVVHAAFERHEVSIPARDVWVDVLRPATVHNNVSIRFEAHKDAAGLRTEDWLNEITSDIAGAVYGFLKPAAAEGFEICVDGVLGQFKACEHLDAKKYKEWQG